MLEHYSDELIAWSGLLARGIGIRVEQRTSCPTVVVNILMTCPLVDDDRPPCSYQDVVIGSTGPAVNVVVHVAVQA